jgi:5'-methylthioadenosine phosphorylase
VTTQVELAVLGGSGFYSMPGLSDVDEAEVETPFGSPSDAIRIGTLGGRRVAFLARHGRGHTLLPSEVPQRANFWALKSLGVSRVLAVSAVGSLREEFRPGEFVIPDQLIDRTHGIRPATFFGEGIVAHAGFGEPFCPQLRAAADCSAREGGFPVHDGGTYVVIEGPAFGTRAESELYRAWGAGIVGMTALPEAKLARESEMCYAVLAAVTDYDSWRAGHEAVTAATVFEVLAGNVRASRDVVAKLAATDFAATCDCQTTLDSALVTPPKAISEAAALRLAPILARRLRSEART